MTEPGVRLDAFAVAPCGEHGAIRIELDSAGEPHSKMTQAENLVAQVSDLAELGMGPVGELSLVLEFLADRGVTSIRAPVRNPFEGGVPHTLGSQSPIHVSTSRRFQASSARRNNSTFSCDIGHQYPARSRLCQWRAPG